MKDAIVSGLPRPRVYGLSIGYFRFRGLWVWGLALGFWEIGI